MPPLLRLLRPGNVVLSFVAVAVGGVLSAGAAAFAPGQRLALGLAMAAAAAVGSGANALNDALDIQIDRINRPDRPVASGAVSVGTARRVGWALSVAGVVAAMLVGPVLGAIAAASVALLAVYNRWLKGTAGLGNLAVALVIAAAPLLGALAVGPVTAAVVAAVGLTFLVTLAREVAKDVEDAVGDAAGGARTLAVRWGERRASAVALAVVGMTLALAPVPAFTGVGRAFLAYVLGAAVCLLVAGWALGLGALGRPAESRLAARRARAWLKASMVAGVVALLVAGLG